MRAMDAADFLIALSNSRDDANDDGISNLKLQKLLYLAQAASLQKTGEPLFDDPIEAWQLGPVVPDVYRRFKDNHRQPIGSSLTIREALSRLDPEKASILMDTYMRYLGYSASGLVTLTHRQGSPWSRVYDPARPRLDREITVENIREHAPRQEGGNPFYNPTLPEKIVDGADVYPRSWVDDTDDDD